MAEIDGFHKQRRSLFAIAYRMLGTVSDAEDILQEAYVKWQLAKEKQVLIRNEKSYLSTIVTRLCLEQMRSARVKRETYVGTWLPEPIVSEESTHTPSISDPESMAGLADSLSTAFLVMLESLSPVERAAFLLREVFDYSYQEISEIINKNEANCRQLVRRAKERTHSRKQRFPVSDEHKSQMLWQFMQTCLSGDVDGFVSLLADDVILYSDGGGKAKAAINPIFGADRVQRFCFGLARKFPEEVASSFGLINGEPGVIMYLNGKPHSTMVFEYEDEKIKAIYIVRNPDKLERVPGFEVQQA